MWRDPDIRARIIAGKLASSASHRPRFPYPETLTFEQDQVLLGSLFGDACMRRRAPRAFPYLVEHHAEPQKDYLLWKAELFREFRPKLSFNRVSKWRMLTSQAPVFDQYREMFYPDGKKILPQAALDRMDALAIAVWCMDDGSIRRHRGRARSFVLCTDQWPLTDQQRLTEWFTTRWGIVPAVAHVKTYWRLRFRVDASIALLRLIGPFLHPIFRDKWGLADPLTFSPAMPHADRGRIGRATRVGMEGLKRHFVTCVGCEQRFLAKDSEVARGGGKFHDPVCYRSNRRLLRVVTAGQQPS